MQLPLSNETVSRPYIDAEWDAQLSEALGDAPEAYELLRPSPEKVMVEKAKFFADRTYNPHLLPDSVDLDKTARREDALTILRGELESDGTLHNFPLRLAYLWRVEEEIANTRMVASAVHGDMTEFNTLNREIYGEPNPVIFAATVDWFREQAAGLLHHDKQEVREAAISAMQALVDRGGDQSALTPDIGTFHEVRQRHMAPGVGYFALLCAGITPPEGAVTPGVGEPIIRKVLEHIGAADYTVKPVDGTTWSVSQDAKEVRQPQKYSLPWRRFMGLVLGHEIGTHTLEAINGARTGIMLLRRGLAGYEQGNEGRAVIREQVVYETFEAFAKLPRWQDVMRRHLAVSLAVGLHGVDSGQRAQDGRPRSFSEVFQIINALDRMLERAKGSSDIPAADKKADDRTWSLLARVLKGTDGQGGAYYKDMVYLEGNIACWAQARERPELIDEGDLAKFDITNPWHIALLQAYGILPGREPRK